MSRPDGGPAFPHDDWSERLAREVTQPGMSLRDYFAAKALTGWITGPTVVAGREAAVAELCYRLADAMLSERSKP